MLFVYGVLCIIGLVWAHPTYVPQKACLTMSPESPGHGNAPPQNTQAPYDFVLDKNTMQNSDKVKFSILQKNGGPAFKGFMIQARSSAESTPIGTFTTTGGDSQTMACTNERDTATHTSSDNKTRVTVTWSPPANFKGAVNFYVTTVEDLVTFWVKTSAGTLIVQ